MCRSRAEGGQRCYSHALKSVQRASEAHSTANGWEEEMETAMQLRTALIDLASTPTGREQLASIASFDPVKTTPNKDSGARDGVSPDIVTALRRLRSSVSPNARAVSDTGHNPALQAARLLEEGELVAERNRALGDLTRNEKVERFGDRAKRIAQSFGPAAAVAAVGIHQASSNFTVGITVGAVAGALGAALQGYARWKKARTKPWMPERERAMRLQAQRDVNEREEHRIIAQERAERDESLSRRSRLLARSIG